MYEGLRSSPYLVRDVGGRDELEEIHDGEDGSHARDENQNSRPGRSDSPRHLHRKAVLNGQNLRSEK